jgi:hypothetical protein
MARGCRRGWRVHPRFCAAMARGRSDVLMSYVPRLPGGRPGRIFRRARETGAPLCLPGSPTERCGSLIPPSDSIAVQTHLSAIPFGRPVLLRVQKADSIAGNAPSP